MGFRDSGQFFFIRNDLPLHWDVLGPLDDSLDGDGLDGSFGDDLWDVLSQVLNGIIVSLSHLSRDCLEVSSLFIVGDSDLFWNSLNPFSNFVVSDSLLEGDVLDSALT